MMAQHLQELYSSPFVTGGYERNGGIWVGLGNDKSLGLLKPDEDQGFILYPISILLTPLN